MSDNCLDSYYYEIPKELIAQTPTINRQDSRLFVLDTKNKKFHHKKFIDIIDYFDAGDCLVINTAKVVPSRIFGKKETGGKVEVLVLDPCQKNKEFKVLMKPFVEVGKIIFFDDGYEACVKSKSDGETVIEFNKPDIIDFLQTNGLMPLPHYINRKNELAKTFAALDRQRYQAVYADSLGAIAAPTAGLHFTQEILQDLKDKGVKIAHITLYVGWGTFKPISSQNINEHIMPSEKFFIDEQNADIINSAKLNGKKITPVGTTSTRALETVAQKTGFVKDGKLLIKPFEGESEIFIYPGYKFQVADNLITNLHFPKSTPLMMASAFASRELLLEAYQEAIKEKYRFFSYGDAMIII
jgi:S-adenosylmethionine:tRNA ribosyltransferase-isomerase